MSLVETVTSTYIQQFGSQPAVLVRAPGRINLLGEHVDYNDGLVLPAAIDRAVYIAAGPQTRPVVTLSALDMALPGSPAVSFSLVELERKTDLQGAPLPGWALYPASVAWVLGQSGYEVRGLQAVYASDIPVGSGLSSSAAVEVGFAVALEALGGWSADRMTLARLCQRAENEFVGVACGLMDQFASANGVAGHALFFDTRSLEWKPAELPVGTTLVVADSGMRRSLATSQYNERRRACEEAVAVLRQSLPQMRSLRDISPVEFAAYSDRLSPVVRRRAEHVVKEIARVQSAYSALKRQDRHAFGALMFAGHASLRDLYEVSIPELDVLVETARRLPGCLGARLTGAGFGGCTINLVEADQVEGFIPGLEAGYQLATGRQAKVYPIQASDGASLLPLQP